MNEIVLKNIVKSYRDKTVLNGFSCELDYGSVSMLTGESGSGKTTVLRLIAGLEKPDKGEINAPLVSMVFQEDRLIGHMTALQNCMLVCDDGKRASEVLLELGLEPHDKRPVSQYSGGMARRVAIARALLAESDVLLLDEPFKGLDGERLAMAAEAVKRHRKGRTLIVVTHSESEAELFGCRGAFEKGLKLTVINDVDIR